MDTHKEFLTEAAGVRPPHLVQLTVRELLAKWGHKRRGYWVVARIESDLEEAGLFSDPPFTHPWIDGRITLVPRAVLDGASAEPSDGGSGVVESELGTPAGDITLLVRSLRAASQGVCLTNPDASLLEAQSLMLSNDYSQLAVVSGPRNLLGAITWESIVQAGMRGSVSVVRDCVVGAEKVNIDDDLIRHIPRIVEEGYVFVQGQDRTITGIVTTADLSEEFARLALPFFLIEEVERRLRRAIDRKFSAEELSSIFDPADGRRHVSSADDMTIGEYVRLLEEPGRWKATGWVIERSIFVADLDAIREIRNDVVHFSPDPLDDAQLDRLRRFIHVLKIIDP